MSIVFPPELPISERAEELIEAIQQHQVLIVAGETGSGKSTQLPKLCLAAGFTKIGHTQPRRIAARAVAERVADELDTSVGDRVGFAVRFNDRVGPNTQIKLMTDGILLAEIQRDRQLSKYEVLIVDEAHERSLNIDFLLGYLKQLVRKRPDLKVIVTSATIDTDRFSQHFDGAPVIEVSGRTYPVEVRYRPIEEGDLTDGVCDAVQELWRETSGDTLVFCSGERDIREAAEALTALKLPNTEIFPLYARLSSAEQHRVFSGHTGRRIVLATNIAETSITVPGITSVVDPGLARISRFSARTKVQRLPIEPIAQASANQRAGRCGRISPGVCVRLYDEADFDGRPEFTEPEIQRTNLASVILQMATLRLGRPEDFPFVDRPDGRAINDGIALLEELDAVDPEREGTKRWVTPIGRTLSRLPIDPRLGRMVVEAGERGVLREVSIIAAALSVMDPRERPKEKREAAAEAHRRFVDPSSDFLSFLNLWEYVAERRSELSSGQFRRLCRREFLNWNRLREWQDVEQQIRRVTRDAGMKSSRNEAKPEQVHRALLAGLLSQIGRQDERTGEYVGPRGTRFVIAPGTPLAKRPPSWIMAAELVETHRLQARMVTRIDPQWVEELADHLVTRTYTNAHWVRERGSAVANERVLLHGLPLVVDRRVQLGRVNPDLARELFIHHALIEGEWDDDYAFRERNAEAIAQVEEMEARSRRRDLLVEAERRHSFFDERLGPDVVSARHFRSWFKKAPDDVLDLTPADLLASDEILDENLHPTTWTVGGHEFSLRYEFDPASPVDGVTVEVPVHLLHSLDPEPFTWNVPGLRPALVEATIRQLPKPIRRELVPVPATVEAVIPHMRDASGSFVEALRKHVGNRAGRVIPSDAFDLEALPRHLRPTFMVLDENGDLLAAGKDLERVRHRIDARARRVLQAGGHPLEASGLSSFPADGLPQTVQTVEDGFTVTAFPSFVDAGETVDVQLLHDELEQAEHMWAGSRRLLRLTTALPLRTLTSRIVNTTALALATSVYPTADSWIDDCVDAALDHLLEAAGGPAWEAARFRALQAWVKAKISEVLVEIADVAEEALLASQRIRSGDPAPDITRHLDRLVTTRTISEAGYNNLDLLSRSMRALELRADRAASSPQRDRMLAERAAPLDAEIEAALRRAPHHPAAHELFWMREAWLISVFAQELGTRGGASEKKIRTLLRSMIAS